MSKKKLTPWFDGDVKPIRAGVYETKPDESTTFQYWDGKEWKFCSITIDGAVRGITWRRSQTQDAPWRGLARRPR